MQFESLQSILLYICIGVILGIYVTRKYHEKTKNYHIGKTIEGILISRNVEELLSLSQDLNSLIVKLQLESNNLLEEIKHAQDIETISYDDDLLKNSGNGKFTLEDGKLINMENNSDFKDDTEKE
jgi:hypothetical protein